VISTDNYPLEAAIALQEKTIATLEPETSSLGSNLPRIHQETGSPESPLKNSAYRLDTSWRKKSLSKTVTG
jgi:hypothetical protein